MGWIKKSEVKRRFAGISDATVYRWVKAGILPEPTYFGARSPRWDDEEVDAAGQRLREKSSGLVGPAAALTAAARGARESKVNERRAQRTAASVQRMPRPTGSAS
jgi:predicted DNA-binding transcriptional regulator AlpA